MAGTMGCAGRRYALRVESEARCPDGGGEGRVAMTESFLSRLTGFTLHGRHPPVELGPPKRAAAPHLTGASPSLFGHFQDTTEAPIRQIPP
jgi:hypothetical protein